MSAATLDRTVTAGQRVVLDFSVTDPDDDEITVAASQEHGPQCEVTLFPGRCSVQIPADAPAGSRVHVIIEAVDDGVPALTGYARFVLTVG